MCQLSMHSRNCGVLWLLSFRWTSVQRLQVLCFSLLLSSLISFIVLVPVVDSSLCLQACCSSQVFQSCTWNSKGWFEAFFRCDNKYNYNFFLPNFSSVGYSLLWRKEKSITVQPDRVTVGETASFGCVLMNDFFKALVKKVERNTTSFDNFLRMYVPPGNPLKQREGEPIKVLTLYKHIQVLLTFAFCRPQKYIFWVNYYSCALDNFSRVWNNLCTITSDSVQSLSLKFIQADSLSLVFFAGNVDTWECDYCGNRRLMVQLSETTLTWGMWVWVPDAVWINWVGSRCHPGLCSSCWQGQTCDCFYWWWKLSGKNQSLQIINKCLSVKSPVKINLHIQTSLHCFSFVFNNAPKLALSCKSQFVQRRDHFWNAFIWICIK